MSRSIRFCSHTLVSVFLLGTCMTLRAEDPKQIVQQAVKAELSANENDHSRWLYFEEDKKPKASVTQWVAQTSHGDLKRILKQNGQEFPADQQKKKMDSFVRDLGAQDQQRQAGRHDDEQATKLLKLLPEAFQWSQSSDQDGNVSLHFKPDQKFRPPSREARVFAAMEGDMMVSKTQHRIVSLRGRLVHDVKFGGGLFATLRAGGTFDIERRKIGANEWQITETHVHIDGHALFFKNISEQEDELKSKFRQLSDSISFQQAEEELLK